MSTVPDDIAELAIILSATDSPYRADAIAAALLAEREAQRIRDSTICRIVADDYARHEQNGWQKQREDELRYIADVIDGKVYQPDVTAIVRSAKP